VNEPPRVQPPKPYEDFPKSPSLGHFLIPDNRMQQKLSTCFSGINDSREILTASENNNPLDDDYEAQGESGSMNSSSYMSLKRHQ